MATRLQLSDGTDTWETTVDEFIEDNQDDADDLIRVVPHLLRGHTIEVGGGAAGQFTITALD